MLSVFLPQLGAELRVVVVTHFLPRDGGKAQTAIQVPAFYLIELG